MSDKDKPNEGGGESPKQSRGITQKPDKGTVEIASYKGIDRGEQNVSDTQPVPTDDPPKAPPPKTPPPKEDD